MCEDCGCQEANKEYFSSEHHQHQHHHHHHHHHHEDKHDDGDDKRKKGIVIEQNVLELNNQIAHQNSHWLGRHKVKAINVISSPGSGKTLLLEKTLERMKDRMKIAILVGDQQTDNDAVRLFNKGGKVKQINTHSSCHLDATMIKKELGTFVDVDDELLIIENIGNLVCPSAFDLGEHVKIALLSTTEGEDKPIKYPVLFHRASLIVITKTDLIPYLDWSEEKTIKFIRQINPTAQIIMLSAKTGHGMDKWCEYLQML